MLIKRLALYNGALEARGMTVIIDVFRAFTCEPLLYHFGVREIVLEYDIEKCLEMEGNYIRIGENNELPIEGFDLTNSPFHIMEKGKNFFYGRNVIHRTTSGVLGAVYALEHSEEVILASFNNARATAEYIKNHNPELVSIVSMGIRTKENAVEDDYCGDYIESILMGNNFDYYEAVNKILLNETAQKFLRGDKPYLPKEDPALCLQKDIFDFVLLTKKKDNIIKSIKCEI
ncbi:2-phosphosulfolactate phosphatase [Candidatus Latescibacterota bacterium]